MNRLSFAVATLFALAFVAFGLHDGLPLLRHDWGLPSFAQGWIHFGIDMISGWDTSGIGQPRPYPTWFLLGPVLAVIGATLGSAAALLVILGAVAGAAVFGCRALVRVRGGSEYLWPCLVAVFLFNPWTYEKLVAGHLTILLSTGMFLLIAAELLKNRPSSSKLFLFTLVATFQIQFAVLVLPFGVAIRREIRTVLIVAAAAVLGFLPSIVGIFVDQSYLDAVPYTLSWQLNNSVELPHALLLDGYSAAYTRYAMAPFSASMGLLWIGALATLLTQWKRAVRLWPFWLLAAVATLYSTGLRGPIASLYNASLSFRPALVFRELFDLLALTLVALVVLAAAGTGRRIAAVLYAAAIVALSAWIIYPPYNWWLPASSIPIQAVNTSTPNVRFALLPWLQPLQYRGKGSGPDPDLFTRDNNVTPVNQYLYSYPVDDALARYTETSDARELESLSVATVYERAGFTSDASASTAAFGAEPRQRGRSQTLATAEPELSEMDVPPSKAVFAAIDPPYLFDTGDEHIVNRDVAPASASTVSSDAAAAWVSTALTGFSYPAFSNPVGGVITTSPSAPLAVPDWHPVAALVKADGRIIDGRGTVLSRRNAWHWVPTRHAHVFFCRGTCSVALWAHREPVDAGHARATWTRGLRFRELLPFLIDVELPPDPGNEATLLLYRVRYDSHWALWGAASKHVVVSNLFNGFIIASARRSRHVDLVETAALEQLGAMITSIIACAVLLALLRRRDAKVIPEAPTRRP